MLLQLSDFIKTKIESESIEKAIDETNKYMKTTISNLLEIITSKVFMYLVQPHSQDEQRYSSCTKYYNNEAATRYRPSFCLFEASVGHTEYIYVCRIAHATPEAFVCNHNKGNGCK